MNENEVPLVKKAATDLVNRFSSEIDYVFKERYTQLGDKSIQTNPYTTMSERERTEAVIDSLAMVMGQLVALSLIHAPKLDVNAVYGGLSKRLRSHGDAYHQYFLHEREIQNAANKSYREGAEAGSANPAANVHDSRPQDPGNEAG